jgi:hypothetical protein
MDWTPGETWKHRQGEDIRREEERVEIKTDFTCLMELRDLEDELSTIGRLLDDQNTCVCKLIGYFDLRYPRAERIRYPRKGSDDNRGLSENC